MVKLVERHIDFVEALFSLSTVLFVPSLLIEVVFALYFINCFFFFEIIEEWIERSFTIRYAVASFKWMIVIQPNCHEPLKLHLLASCFSHRRRPPELGTSFLFRALRHFLRFQLHSLVYFKLRKFKLILRLFHGQVWIFENRPSVCARNDCFVEHIALRKVDIWAPQLWHDDLLLVDVVTESSDNFVNRRTGHFQWVSWARH